MRHYFIHLARWFFLFILLFSLKVSASPCKNCGKENEPGKDPQMLCQACDCEKLTSLASSPSSPANEGLKNSAAKKDATGATNDEIPVPPKLDPSPYGIWLTKDENEGSLKARIQVSDETLDAFEREDGNAYARAVAKILALNMTEIAEDMDVNELDVSLEGEHHCQKKMERRDPQNLHKSLKFFMRRFQKQMKKGAHSQLERFQELHQAQLNAGALQIKKMPIHKKATALTHKRTARIDPSQWPNLSDMGMTLLLSAEFQNSQLMMDLTSVFQAIQEGNMIQLIITRMVVADEGNKAAAATVKPILLGAIIPDPAMNGHTESTDMHLLIGRLPVHVNQDNLMNVLTAIMQALGKRRRNAHLSLHFFLSPQMSIQDIEDPLPSTINIEHSINPDPFLGGFATDKSL